MPRLGSIIALTLLALAVEVFAQRHSELEFAGIPFGVSRETVIEELMKMGYDTYDQGGHTQVPVFKFGDLPVQVDFIFNKNDKFYSFEIRTGRVERARLNKSFEAVAYMSEQFTLKYGKPSGNPSIDESSTLKESLLNLYQQWFSQKVLNIYTALVQKDGRYFAVGSVTHRKLAVEKNASSGRAVDKAPTGKPVF